MTIEKGKPWGSPCSVPAHRIVVESDSELADCAAEVPVSLNGGDVWKSLGSPAVPAVGMTGTKVNVDAIVITIDNEGNIRAASSIEIGSWHKRGRYICIANSSFVKEKNIAPRAHPNDGSLDYLEIDETMSWRQRWSASRRARTGTHIPHPQITTKRVKDIQIDRQHSEVLRIDGIQVNEWQSIRVQIDSDHWQVIV